ncbi:liver carboxylesterase 1F-like [Glandiceps talaboti]
MILACDVNALQKPEQCCSEVWTGRRGTMKLSVVFLALALLGFAHSDPTAETPLGDILGIYAPGELDVTYFRGIRYGQAPVGDQRFKAPLSVTPWAPAVYDATEFGPSCPQNISSFPDWMKMALPNEDVDEDCLFLNVYVPSKTIPPPEKYPVMVFIHGGGFSFGQGMLYESTTLSGLFDVVVVTINYRLGAFGFISTGDEHSPGNYGLHDQILALNWVQENIAAFGGDTELVTIFGESAGGISTSILANSPKAGGFHRFISQSGVAHPGLIIPTERATEFAYNIGYNAGCNTTENPDLTDHALLMDCLRGLTSNELYEATGNMILAPVEDGDIIPSLAELMESGKMQDYDFMAGTLSWEAAIVTTAVPGLDDGEMARPLFNALVRAEVQIMYDENHDQIGDAAIYQYTDWYNEDDNAIRLSNYRHFFNDMTFLAPTVHLLREHAQRGILPPQPTSLTYHYYFDYCPSFYQGPDYVDGAEHAIELVFVFGHLLTGHFAPFVNMTFPQNELDLAFNMATYWTNFAKTGDPNKPNTPPLEWPAFDNDDQKFIEFTVDMTTEHISGENFRADDVAFWLEYATGLHTDICPAEEINEVPDRPSMTFANLSDEEATTAIYTLFIASLCLLATVIFLIVALVVVVRRNRNRGSDQVPLNPY